MIRGKHNQYTSTPNWFTSIAINNQTKTPSVPISHGGEDSSNTITNESTQQNAELPLTVYNKSLCSQRTIVNTDLIIEKQAVSIAVDTIGQLVLDNYYSSTGYKEIVEGSMINMSIGYGFSDSYGIAFYDLSKKLVSAVPLTPGNQSIQVPSRTRYFRTCAASADDQFGMTYLSPSSYSTELLTKIYNGTNEDYTVLVESFQETINKYSCPLKGLSLVVDDPLKIEIDSNGNLHLNINNLFGGGLDIQRLQEYLTSNKYLTLTKADEMFLTPTEGDTRYLLKQVFSKIFTAYDIYNNVVDITDATAVIDSIKINYNFWSSGYVSALGKQEGGGSATSPMTLSDLSNVASEGGEVQTWVNQQNYATSTQVTNLENKISNLIQSVSSATEALNGEPGVLYVLH